MITAVPWRQMGGFGIYIVGESGCSRWLISNKVAGTGMRWFAYRLKTQMCIDMGKHNNRVAAPSDSSHSCRARLELYELSPVRICLWPGKSAKDLASLSPPSNERAKVWTVVFMRTIAATVQMPFLFCQLTDHSSVNGPHAGCTICPSTERWKTIIRLLNKLVTMPTYTDHPKMESPNPAA